MTLTYDKTNKTLAAAAATAMLMVILTSVCNNLSSTVYMLFRESRISSILANIIIIVPYAVLWLPVPIVLLMRKKNILTAIAFLLPVIYALLVQPTISNILIPLLLGGSFDFEVIITNGIVSFVCSIPLTLFFLVIAVSCVTKGKLFGEKLGFVLIVLGVWVYLNALISPFITYFVPYVLRGMSTRYLENILENYFVRSQLDIAVIVESMVYPLIALAFCRPDRELIPEQPAEEVTE